MTLPYEFDICKILEEKRTSRKNLDAVKDWLRTTSTPDLQDEFVALFLISCENDLEAAKKSIGAYFRIRNGSPDLFKYDLESEMMRKVIKTYGICVIPKRMGTNTAIIWTKVLDTNYRNYDCVAVLKLSLMCLQIPQIRDPPKEFVAVIDMAGFGFMHFMRLKIRPTVTVLKYAQEGLPLKLRNIYVLNSNYIFDKWMGLVKFCISGTLIEGIKTFLPGTKMDRFFEECVPASCVPGDYGGELPPFQELMDRNVEELVKIRNFFEREEQLRSSYK